MKTRTLSALAALGAIIICQGAPVLAADEKAPAGHDHAAMQMGMQMNMSGSTAEASDGGMAKAGDIAVDGAFVRAMLPGQPVGGGYLVISNSGSADDRLLSASSPSAGSVEIHEMSMQGQTMTMRKLSGSLDVPAGQKVELQPGGMHLMFMKVKTPFKLGDSVPLTLNFEKAGKLEVSLPVKAFVPGGQ
ncbi:copper chaperone PCu(A)C [Neorhizobium sp. NCHU2750]|uniref:copper chaperone PCu(A)C n=1 Tax=Neorhizobium sp. NCHU2750 TaxID=1825976 RepID=UPI000E714D1C